MRKVLELSEVDNGFWILLKETDEVEQIVKKTKMKVAVDEKDAINQIAEFLNVDILVNE